MMIAGSTVSDTACTIAADCPTCVDEARFLGKYDRLFPRGVVAAIQARRVQGFAAGVDDGDVPGPVVAGEYLLGSPYTDLQPVFVRDGGTWKPGRIPFQS